MLQELLFIQRIQHAAVGVAIISVVMHTCTSDEVRWIPDDGQVAAVVFLLMPPIGLKRAQAKDPSWTTTPGRLKSWPVFQYLDKRFSNNCL